MFSIFELFRGIPVWEKTTLYKKSFLTCLSWNKNKTFPTYLQLPRVYSAAKWIIMSYLVWDASAWHVIVWGASGWHVNLMQGTRLHIYLHHNNHNYNLLHYILHTPAPTSALPLFYLDPPFGFYLTLLIFFLIHLMFFSILLIKAHIVRLSFWHNALS